MDVLKAEMARKRALLEKSSVIPEGKKYFKRGDLAAKQAEEYWEKYYGKHGVASEKEEVANDSCEKALKVFDHDSEELSREEVVKRLRERNEPIRLFAENDHDTLTRYRRLFLEAPELKEGYRNDLKAALDTVDQEFVNEVIQGQQEEGKHDVKVDAVLLSQDEINEMAKNLGQCGSSKDCKVIYDFFNSILQSWGVELNARDNDLKRTPKGKFASATYHQTLEHIRPLFTQLKNETVAADIRDHLVNITRFMLERDYILANNMYMEMAIGNAPWPVGVTASGIHQRPGSEKMYVKNVAHVLNDETQRKYIQGLKRLMTRYQNYNPTDPSKSVDYVPSNTVQPQS